MITMLQRLAFQCCYENLFELCYKLYVADRKSRRSAQSAVAVERVDSTEAKLVEEILRSDRFYISLRTYVDVHGKVPSEIGDELFTLLASGFLLTKAAVQVLFSANEGCFSIRRLHLRTSQSEDTLAISCIHKGTLSVRCHLIGGSESAVVLPLTFCCGLCNVTQSLVELEINTTRDREGRYGSSAELRCSLDALASTGKLKQLRSLNISQWDVDPDGPLEESFCQHESSCFDMRRLSSSWPELNSLALPFFRGLDICPLTALRHTLRKLRICPIDIPDEDLLVLQTLEKLEWLDVNVVDSVKMVIEYDGSQFNVNALLTSTNGCWPGLKYMDASGLHKLEPDVLDRFIGAHPNLDILLIAATERTADRKYAAVQRYEHLQLVPECSFSRLSRLLSDKKQYVSQTSSMRLLKAASKWLTATHVLRRALLSCSGLEQRPDLGSFIRAVELASEQADLKGAGGAHLSRCTGALLSAVDCLRFALPYRYLMPAQPKIVFLELLFAINASLPVTASGAHRKIEACIACYAQRSIYRAVAVPMNLIMPSLVASLRVIESRIDDESTMLLLSSVAALHGLIEQVSESRVKMATVLPLVLIRRILIVSTRYIEMSFEPGGLHVLFERERDAFFNWLVRINWYIADSDPPFAVAFASICLPVYTRLILALHAVVELDQNASISSELSVVDFNLFQLIAAISDSLVVPTSRAFITSDDIQAIQICMQRVGQFHVFIFGVLSAAHVLSAMREADANTQYPEFLTAFNVAVSQSETSSDPLVNFDCAIYHSLQRFFALLKAPLESVRFFGCWMLHLLLFKSGGGEYGCAFYRNMFREESGDAAVQDCASMSGASDRVNAIIRQIQEFYLL